jgi:hypothetical protein
VAGQPRKFESGAELIELWTLFCDDIVRNDYKDIPSQTSFCRWLAANYRAVDRKTIYNTLNEYFPTIKGEFERLQSDTIAQGGMLGKYNSTMSIFVLKNWNSWVDKVETTNTNYNVEMESVISEVERMVKSDTE